MAVCWEDGGPHVQQCHELEARFVMSYSCSYFRPTAPPDCDFAPNACCSAAALCSTAAETPAPVASVAFSTPAAAACACFCAALAPSSHQPPATCIHNQSMAQHASTIKASQPHNSPPTEQLLSPIGIQFSPQPELTRHNGLGSPAGHITCP